MEYGIIALTAIIIGFIAGYFIHKKFVSATQLISNEELENIKNDLAGYIRQVEMQTSNLTEYKIENTKINTEITEVKLELASKNEMIKNIQKIADEKKAEVEELNKKFNEEFKNIANSVIANSSDNFKKMVFNDLNLVLNPLKEDLKSFDIKLGQNQTQQTTTITVLKEQITQLTNMNQVMSDETKNLTKALKGESKTRGNWGEVILETILDRSGLVKDEHYVREQNLKNDEGSNARPDVIINLPENRNLIIDSKLSLVDYERYSSADDDAEKIIHLKKHTDAMRKHIKDLSAKNYQKLHGINTPDFIIMFIPLESAFHIAIEFDRELFVEAYEKNIVLTSPTTLIPTLKIIYNIWRQETQNKNAMAIAEAGGRLYDKFAGFVDNMKKIGTSIDSTKKVYDDAFKQLSEGRGNLISQTERMRELGAKASKRLSIDVSED